MRPFEKQFDETPTGDPLPNEIELDALLGSFFEREIPADLPVCPPADAVLHPRAFDFVAIRRQAFDWRPIGWMIAASLILAVSCFLLRPAHEQPFAVIDPPTAPTIVGEAPVFHSDGASTDFDLVSSWTEVGRDGVNYAVLDGSQTMDRRSYRTAQGWVEQRTAVHWTTVAFFEPTLGDYVESTVPEVDVEIVPLLKN